MKYAKTCILTCLLALALVGFGAHPAFADLQFEEVQFSLTDPGGGPSRTAGAHPDLTTFFSFEKAVVPGTNGPQEGPKEDARSLDVALPPGMVGNPSVASRCSGAELANPAAGWDRCPADSQIGFVTGKIVGGGTYRPFTVGLYNIDPGPGEPARFGFNYQRVVATIVPSVRPGDFGISSGSLRISQATGLADVKVELWGVPSDPVHDPDRIFDSVAGQKSNLPRLPFLTNPTSCSDTPAAFVLSGVSWQHPDAPPTTVTKTADPDGTPFVFDGCELLPFAPRMEVSSLSHATEAPTGLDVDVTVPQSDSGTGRTTAHVRKVRLTLPKGVSVSPSSAAGLGACSLAQIGLGTNDPPACPDSSKLGTVTIRTPLLSEELQGDVILAKQNENPFDSLIALYIAVKGPGFYLKLPGRVDLNGATGQLISTFDNTPQLPFEKLHLALRGGPRAALVTPATCGTYTAEAEFLSWATSKAVTQDIPMSFDRGCGAQGFAPRLRAGSTSPLAGDFTPFNLQITRDDGEQNLSRIEATLPEGVLAKLAGVPLCAEAQAVSGSCPAASQVGTTTVAAGPGSLPVYVPEPGKAPTAVYLGGPYRGAPYSLVVKVPAQAGPFDLGNVVVRNALNVDPVTTQVTATSDALPQILQGIPISYRDVRVEVTRNDFTLNPTSCDPMSVSSTLTSSQGATAHPSDHFQVTNCAGLGFAPKFSLKVSGGTKRSSYPALQATLAAKKGQANIAKVAVTLPHSEFLAQNHIKTICTRVQFAADNCPKGSIYGFARAKTPLLDETLSGPVYLRSSSHPLPDLVAALHGPIDVDLVGRIDSIDGGIRSTFESVPDAPVSKFTLNMKGGKKGLLVNSRNLCAGPDRAKVLVDGQNGKTADQSPVVQNSCGKARKGSKGKK
jgi:hypothetical protein